MTCHSWILANIRILNFVSYPLLMQMRQTEKRCCLSSSTVAFLFLFSMRSPAVSVHILQVGAHYCSSQKLNTGRRKNMYTCWCAISCAKSSRFRWFPASSSFQQKLTQQNPRIEMASGIFLAVFSQESKTISWYVAIFHSYPSPIPVGILRIYMMSRTPITIQQQDQECQWL